MVKIFRIRSSCCSRCFIIRERVFTDIGTSGYRDGTAFCSYILQFQECILVDPVSIHNNTDHRCLVSPDGIEPVDDEIRNPSHVYRDSDDEQVIFSSLYELFPSFRCGDVHDFCTLRV